MSLQVVENNVVKFDGLEERKEECVMYLQKMIERVEAGEVDGFCLMGFTPDGNVTFSVTSDLLGEPANVIFGCELFKQTIINQME